ERVRHPLAADRVLEPLVLARIPHGRVFPFADRWAFPTLIPFPRTFVWARCAMANAEAPRPRRLRRVLSVIALIIVVVLAAAIARARRFPRTTGTIEVAGIDGPIEILRGPYGVPHVIAKTARDAYFGLGFCEAQDRTLQLELFRRAASGRLAELIGEGGVGLDRFSHTIGFHKIAERQIANSSPRARELTVAFTDGINAGLRSLRATPPELALLGDEPAAWEPLDCMAVARL